MQNQYDVVIIGSGLGGLASAIILGKEGYKVCVLEKNNQYGGNLQTFARDKTIFDTGVHYIGGLSPGQNLNHYFNYLGILEDLNLKQMDLDGFDVISFDNDERLYKHAQGYENFVNSLSDQFPEEKQNIEQYCQELRQMCSNFPLYNLQKGAAYYDKIKIFEERAKSRIEAVTDNEKLRAVLAGSNYLYAGDGERTPFYVHALSVNSYIESSYRCVNGGSQITKALLKQIKKYGGSVYNHQEVVKIDYSEGAVSSVTTDKGDRIRGKIFISNIEPKTTLNLLGEEKFRKSYVNRVKAIESTIAAFSLYLVLKPETFKYCNNNFYHFKDYNNVWKTQDYTQETWPEGFMLSMGVRKNTTQWADSITAMTYMHYDELKPWEDTNNTVHNKNERGQTYEEFKKAKAEIFIDEIEKRFPNIRQCIAAVHTSTPLSYRDYIGSNAGSMYGYVKDVNNPMMSFISPKTKIKNLFFTGQSLNMHGILGVTIGAVITCSEIIGRDYLVDKILKGVEQH